MQSQLGASFVRFYLAFITWIISVIAANNTAQTLLQSYCFHWMENHHNKQIKNFMNTWNYYINDVWNCFDVIHEVDKFYIVHDVIFNTSFPK